MADGIHQRKHELRAALRVARRALAPAAAAAESATTARALERLLDALDPPALASYLAAPGELALDAVHDWWWRSGRGVLVPRVAAPGILAWHVIAPDTPLVVGAYGIREPAPATLACALPAGVVVLVPGVGFGADGRRLGQGGGYYDRVLAQPGLRSIGVGFACQRRDDLPVEAHDRAVDGVVLGGIVLRDPRPL
ncbi:MAG TPA: 5-formyltetrahydrofolate cyclo-ligase [Planctomycetota bacterium]|nr:5-formyltetrahydrofolate cyclo-ligase [Planctomycetota bacterium]